MKSLFPEFEKDIAESKLAERRRPEMKMRRYKATYPSFGIVVSRDAVLQQWEPYEVIHFWEPYVRIYFWRSNWTFTWRVSVNSRLGRWFSRQREKQERTI